MCKKSWQKSFSLSASSGLPCCSAIVNSGLSRVRQMSLLWYKIKFMSAEKKIKGKTELGNLGVFQHEFV